MKAAWASFVSVARACCWFGQRADELKAYRGRCPDADVPFGDAKFDGKIITCPHHHWGFDCTSGKCVTHTTPKVLYPYPVRIEGDEILVDVGPAKKARPPAC